LKKTLKVSLKVIRRNSEPTKWSGLAEKNRNPLLEEAGACFKPNHITCFTGGIVQLQSMIAGGVSSVADGFCRIVQPFAIRYGAKKLRCVGFGLPSTRNLSAPTSRAIFSGGSKALPPMRPAAGRQVSRRPEG
jgi:hypothetical protein